MHTCGTLVLVRLGEMIRVHTETMIPNGRPDEITIEPKHSKKVSPDLPHDASDSCCNQA